MKLNILFFIRSLGRGGAERQLVNLAVNLKARGHAVSVIIMYEETTLAEELSLRGVGIHSLEKKARWDLIRPMLRLRKIIRRVDPDIIHGYGPVVNILCALYKKVFGKILVVWGVRIAYVDLRKYDRTARFVYWLECRMSRVADLVISNSEAGKRYAIKNGFDPRNISVVYNGIDTVTYRPNRRLKEVARTHWGLDGNDKIIGIVGRIDAQKDHYNFIDAFAKLPDAQKRNTRAVCIGAISDRELEPLRRRVALHELDSHFIWELQRDDIEALLNGLDLLVSASDGEGFSNVIAEAMATGVPCVVTDVGDSKAIVGDWGTVVPPKNSCALAKGISQMLSTDYLGNSNHLMQIRSRIVEKFSLEKLTLETERRLTALVSDQIDD